MDKGIKNSVKQNKTKKTKNKTKKQKQQSNWKIG